MKNIVNRIISFFLASTPESPKKETDKSLVELFGIIAALSIIFLIWFNYPSFITWMDKPSYQVQIPLLPSAMVPESINPNDFHKLGENFGTFGDAYGSLNTLFSGFAFAILIISLFMQRQELKEQRKELAAQREEISKSNDIAEAQRKITEQQSSLINQQLLDSKIQAFYQLLFKYLDEKNRKIESMRYNLNSKISGERIFKYFKIFFEDKLYYTFKNEISLNDIDADILNKFMNETIPLANKETENQLIEVEYIEYICFILRFIKQNKSIGITKNAIETFIAYQSVDEMYCMMLLAHFDDELFDFIENYSLLRKINTCDNSNLNKLIFEYYSESAYCP